MIQEKVHYYFNKEDLGIEINSFCLVKQIEKMLQRITGNVHHP
jgi:hypothetical protein